MIVHLKDGFGVEFTAYEGQMMKELTLTSFTFYEAYNSFELLAQ